MRTISSLESANIAVRYYGECPDTHTQIIETVARLPEEVRDFVSGQCRFISAGRSIYGMVLPGSIGVDDVSQAPENIWIVLLRDPLPKRDAHGIIAHEIAHAFLKHDRLSPDGYPGDSEQQVAGLAKQWGFTGKGADAVYCSRRARIFRTSAAGKPKGE